MSLCRGIFSIGAGLAIYMAFAPATSRACSIPANSDHQLDPDEIGVDQEPPSKVSVVDYYYARPDNVDGYCWGMAFVTLNISPATDDRTDAGHMGYLLGGTGDSWPEGFGFGGHDDLGPVRADYGLSTYDTLYLNWADMTDDGSQTIDFSFTISAVDLAGNQGPPSDPIRIYDPGSAGGCATGGNGDLSTAIVFAFVLICYFISQRKNCSRSML